MTLVAAQPTRSLETPPAEPHDDDMRQPVRVKRRRHYSECPNCGSSKMVAGTVHPLTTSTRRQSNGILRHFRCRNCEWRFKSVEPYVTGL